MFRVFHKLKWRDRQDRAAEKLANLAIVVIGERCMTWLGRVVIRIIVGKRVRIGRTMITRLIFARLIITVVMMAMPNNDRVRRFAQRMHVHVRCIAEYNRQQIRPGGE